MHPHERSQQMVNVVRDWDTTERGAAEMNCADSSSELSAARARLLDAAARYQTQHPVAEEYYGGDKRIHPEEPVHEPAQKRWMGGVLTRNHYGCTVLNAAHALFIDVDVLERNDERRLDRWEDRSDSHWADILIDLHIVLGSEESIGFRFYRTAAGIRILATTREFEPDSTESLRLMTAAGADAAFVNLCRLQRNFRARLTPKPWRCGLRRPPNSYPRVSASEQDRFNQWLSQYKRACRAYATCRYIGHVGPTDTHERIAPIIELHDRATKALESLPLA